LGLYSPRRDLDLEELAIRLSARPEHRALHARGPVGDPRGAIILLRNGGQRELAEQEQFRAVRLLFRANERASGLASAGYPEWTTNDRLVGAVADARFRLEEKHASPCLAVGSRSDLMARPT
jgi:hypothetical protein